MGLGGFMELGSFCVENQEIQKHHEAKKKWLRKNLENPGCKKKQKI